MKLISWTVNEKEKMKKLVEMGVDGIITDYPNRAVEWMKN
jgi:glycerophosphoryl diester phosphodiesterase